MKDFTKIELTDEPICFVVSPNWIKAHPELAHLVEPKTEQEPIFAQLSNKEYDYKPEK